MQYSLFGNHDRTVALTSTNMNKKFILQLIQSQTLTVRHVAMTIECLIRDRRPVTSIQTYFYGLNFWFYRATGRALSSFFSLKIYKGLFKRFDLYMPIQGACYWPPAIRTSYWHFLKQNQDKYADITPSVGLGLLIGPRTKEAVKPKISDFEEHPSCYRWNLKHLKNSNVHQVKIILKTGFLINIDEVMTYAIKRAQLNDQGRICVNDDGTTMKTQKFSRRIQGSFGDFQVFHLAKHGVDIDELGKNSFYCFRKSHIVDCKAQGATEEQLKAMTGHSPNSDVLNRHYLQELDAIMLGGMANIFYSEDSKKEVLPLFDKLRQLSDVKAKHLIHRKLLDEARLQSQMNQDRLAYIQDVENNTITNFAYRRKPLRFLKEPEDTDADTENPPTDSDSDSSDDSESLALPTKHPPQVLQTSIDLQKLAQMDPKTFDPAELFSDPTFQRTHIIPQHEALHQAELDLIALVTSNTYKAHSKANQNKLLQIQLKLVAEKFHADSLHVLDRLAKDLQL